MVAGDRNEPARSAQMVPDWVRHHATAKPDAIALADADTGLERTWAQLHDRVGRLATGLRDRHGLGVGDRVVLLAHNDPRYLELQFACQRAGLIFVPLNYRLSTGELAAICDDCGPGLIVGDEANRALAEQVAQKASVPLLAWAPTGRGSEFEETVASSEPMAGHVARTWDDPTTVLYTSGTSGRPKGVVLTYRTLVGQTLNVGPLYELDAPGTNVLVANPLFHAGGLNVMTNPVLLGGGRVTTMARFEPQHYLEWLADPAKGITHVATVPTLLQMISVLPGFANADFSHIRHVQTGGSPMSRALLQAFLDRHLTLWTGYGGTESGPTVAVINSARREKYLSGACGRMVLNTEIRLVDEDGQDVAPGTPGEILLRGPAITPGYWRKDPAAFFLDGWFRTGDIGLLDADGDLHFVDRTSNMFKSGNEKVYPTEVEQVLNRHPSIDEAVVVGVPDDRWLEVGAVFVVPVDGAEVTMDTVREACADQLARYKVPKHLRVVAELERTATGKIARLPLRERFLRDRPNP